MLTKEKVVKHVLDGWDYRRPTDLEAVIDRMLATFTHGDKLFDKLEVEFGLTPGLYTYIRAYIKEQRALECVPQRSAAAARADRVLRITNSDGKSTSRKFN